MNDNKAFVLIVLIGAAFLASILIFGDDAMDNETTKKFKEQEITKREQEKTKQLQLQWKLDSLKATQK
jgi:hypothetical protein